MEATGGFCLLEFEFAVEAPGGELLQSGKNTFVQFVELTICEQCVILFMKFFSFFTPEIVTIIKKYVE